MRKRLSVAREHAASARAGVCAKERHSRRTQNSLPIIGAEDERNDARVRTTRTLP